MYKTYTDLATARISPNTVVRLTVHTALKAKTILNHVV